MGKGREAYEEHTANHPTMAADRFPAWSELSKWDRARWRLIAKLNEEPVDTEEDT
jgi:hypothetical protein